jgi:hypothetical protein
MRYALVPVKPSAPKLLTVPPPLPPSKVRAPFDEAAFLSGSLAVVSASDLLEWLCLNRKTCTLRLFSRDVEGEVVVVDGQLANARWGRQRGLEALSEIVGCGHGTFDLAPVPDAIDRVFHDHWQGLLLSAVQLLDQSAVEARRRSLQGTSSADPPAPGIKQTSEHAALPAQPPEGSDWEAEVPTLRLPEGALALETSEHGPRLSAEEWIDRGFLALRAGDMDKARDCWRAALAIKPDNRSLQFNLRKLESGAWPARGSVMDANRRAR